MAALERFGGLGRYEGLLGRAVSAAVRASVLDMVRHVTKEKLLGQVLNRRTGTLIRSITASPGFLVTDQAVRGWFGSNLDYARMHEEGFKGTVEVPAHLRRHARGGRFEREARGLGLSLRDLRRQRALMIPVRAHTRKVDIRAKHFLRDTIRERDAASRAKLRSALLHLIRTGNVPSPGQLLTGAL